MAGEFAIKRKVITSRGFSLLEIIFVLAFIGIILVTAATWARKFIDEKTRQTAADAVAQEVYGLLQFVNAENIELFQGGTPAVAKKVTNPLYQLPNVPVYPDAAQGTADASLSGLGRNPIFAAHPGGVQSLNNPSSSLLSPYIGRSFSKNIAGSISNKIPVTDGGVTYYSHSLKWSQAKWDDASVRFYFTDNGCAPPKGVASPAHPVYFSQQFLSCHESPALNNSEVRIPRIDLVNKKGSFILPAGTQPGNTSTAVDRVDVYVSFTPVDGNPARFEQFITPLLTAFKTQKILPNTDNIFLVRNIKGQDNSWTFLDKSNGNPITATTGAIHTDVLARYTDLPEMVGHLDASFTYALRFTFDGKGDYLRTDGLNSATKLCWNTETGAAGPCLTAPTEDLLALKKRNNPGESADLLVGALISKSSHSHTAADGTTTIVTDEYYTAPRIQYMAFGRHGTLGPYYLNPNSTPGTNNSMCLTNPPPNPNGAPGDGHCGPGPVLDQMVDINNGAISIPYQACPRAFNDMGLPIEMHPRASASVSSVISGIKLNNNSERQDLAPGDNPVLATQSDILLPLLQHGINPDDHVSVNRLGGVVIQINHQPPFQNEWRISSMVATEDTSSTDDAKRAWQYYNPPWLSVLITTWCSSVPQP